MSQVHERTRPHVPAIFPSSRKRTGLSFGGGGLPCPRTCPEKWKSSMEKRGYQWSRKSMKWISITALLLVVLLRSSAAHQISVDFLVCAGAFMVVLVLFLQTRGRDFLPRQ